MMHLRVISPHDLTDDVVRRLSAHPGVANLIVHEGAARNPAGDVVICDVVREAASGLVDELQHTGLDRRGSIALDNVALELSDAARTAERQAPGEGEVAVVWAELEQRTGEETRLSPTFLVFIAVAAMIAGVGLLLDQPILIVGAMVVGPEFGPLAALCVGLIRWRPVIIGHALLTLAVGFAVAVVATVLSTWLLAAIGLVHPAQLVAARPLTGFIWRPDGLSWVIAFLAGIAGLLSLSTAKSGGLVGVLISVTTIPAAANAAVAIAFGVPEQATGSAVQLGINLAAIVTAGTLTLGVQRLMELRAANRAR
ncbi:MAG TPA: DUF389 domain-containing protein [Pseudolysinimonas sp.]|nr:DUF389 domain-containing protein [Pseudolysinimonas sp.]